MYLILSCNFGYHFTHYTSKDPCYKPNILFCVLKIIRHKIQHGTVLYFYYTLHDPNNTLSHQVIAVTDGSASMHLASTLSFNGSSSSNNNTISSSSTLFKIESPSSNTLGPFIINGGTIRRYEVGWNVLTMKQNFLKCACSLLCTSNVNYGITHATINLLKHVERHHKNEQKIIMHDQATKDNAKQLALIQ